MPPMRGNEEDTGDTLMMDEEGAPNSPYRRGRGSSNGRQMPARQR